MPPPLASSPAPLQVGEHVLCLLSSSCPSPSDAVVVELNAEYREAARLFLQEASREEIAALRRGPLGGGYDLTEVNADVDDAGGFEERERKIEGGGWRLTVDLTTDAIDVDADDGEDCEAKEPQGNGLGSVSHILFREADAGRLHSPPVLPSTAAAGIWEREEPPPNKRRRMGNEREESEEFAEVNGDEKQRRADPPKHPIQRGRVYVHFSSLDRRLDRWVSAAELERTPPSMIVAAGSGGGENMLVNNAKQAELVVAETPGKHVRKLTRSRRRAYEETNPVSEREMGNEAVARMERMREEITKVKNIDAVVIGDCIVDAWYYSPYPSQRGGVLVLRTLYVCPYCLKYIRSSSTYARHRSTCKWTRPPGALVYEAREENMRVYEIDGAFNVTYCQMLCLLGKLFLDHKTLYFDVAPFMFYVVVLNGDIAGFFSKEKPAISSEFNLACILTLPQYQRKGVGRFLISLSYELTKKEGKTGSPERPLSDLGQVSYRRYWTHAITLYLKEKVGNAGVPAKDIAEATGIRVEDVTATLKSTQMISIWKGETYAATSTKALEVAIKKLKGPLLPLRIERLTDTAREQRQMAIRATAKTPNGVRTPASIGRKKYKKSTLKSNPKPNPNGSSSSRSHKVPGGALPPDKLKFLTKFIEAAKASSFTHELDSPNGVKSRALEGLAEKVGMSKANCLQKLRAMADFKLKYERDLRPPSVGPSSGRPVAREPVRRPASIAPKVELEDEPRTPTRTRDDTTLYHCRTRTDAVRDVEHNEESSHQNFTHGVDYSGMQMPVTGLNGILEFSPPGQAILFKRSNSSDIGSPGSGAVIPKKRQGRPCKHEVVDLDAL